MGHEVLPKPSKAWHVGLMRQYKEPDEDMGHALILPPYPPEESEYEHIKSVSQTPIIPASDGPQFRELGKWAKFAQE